jgi:hypothetical protein
VDRHIIRFSRNAGLDVHDYDFLKRVFSCAADLLGASRRNFDAWVWLHNANNHAHPDLTILGELEGEPKNWSVGYLSPHTRPWHTWGGKLPSSPTERWRRAPQADAHDTTRSSLPQLRRRSRAT